MKFLKWYSLFFVSVGVAFVGGIVLGFHLEGFFYPKSYVVEQSKSEEPIIKIEENKVSDVAQTVTVVNSKECIDTDTAYVIIERNMDTGEEVENIGRLSEMYMGMNREQFLASMEDYEACPPLNELERGFVNLEVRRFSSERVEVLMNYCYVKPGKSFYIMVYDGLITVFLEDRETLYLRTGMSALDMPEQIRQELLQGMYIPDEESLYDFLENYTS